MYKHYFSPGFHKTTYCYFRVSIPASGQSHLPTISIKRLWQFIRKCYSNLKKHGFRMGSSPF